MDVEWKKMGGNQYYTSSGKLPGDAASTAGDADDGVGDVTSVSNVRHASGCHGDCGGYCGCYG